MASPCVVLFCKNIGNHRFPKDETRRSSWIEAIQHVKPGLTIKKNSFICSNHFSPEDFVPASQLTLSRSLKILRKNAVPSIFPWNIACRIAKIIDKQQCEPKFNPTAVQGTYSRTPAAVFVEIPQVFKTEQEDRIVDPLDVPNHIKMENIEPIIPVKQEKETDSDGTASPSTEEDSKAWFEIEIDKKPWT